MRNSIKHSILSRQDLGKALRDIRNEINSDTTYSSLENQYEVIEKDYHLMRDFMLRGFKDPQIDAVYRNLLKRVYRLYGAMQLADMTKKRSSYITARINAGALSLESDEVRGELERFVQDVAMASLGMAGIQETSLSSVYARHQQYMSRLFDAVLVSEQWNDNCAEAVKGLLTSPTVDSNDVMLLLSAVMLSAMNVFDLNKWFVMVDVYENASDEKIRQRALAGWVFALPADDMSLFPEVNQTLIRLTGNKDVCREILEMQMQVLYCNNADADNRKIQNDIIPSLMKNNRFEMTDAGIIEKDDDKLQDILDPGAADRNMEELEQSVNKMIDMQKSGSDIYFGGFSQMKRFPFFNTQSNWFCPFYMEHPQIGSLGEKMGSSKFIQKIFKDGPFCDSDKYSFVLAMSSVIERMPDNIKELLNNGESLGMPAGMEINTSDPAYIRRMYLQDLYRFFRLNQYRNDYVNPFAGRGRQSGGLFFANHLLAGVLMSDSVVELEKFLYKHKRYDMILSLATEYALNDVEEHLVMVAMSHLRLGHSDEAESLFSRILRMNADSEQAIKGMAQISFASRKYPEAETYYGKLVALHPDNRNYVLNKAVSQLCCGKLEEGMAVIFRLDYEHPEDNNVRRALAWGQLLKGDAKKAGEIYDALIEGGRCIRADFLNSAYAGWFCGDISSAADRLRRYVYYNNENMGYEDFESAFAEDSTLLDSYGITATERKIMTDVVFNAGE